MYAIVTRCQPNFYVYATRVEEKRVGNDLLPIQYNVYH